MITASIKTLDTYYLFHSTIRIRMTKKLTYIKLYTLHLGLRVLYFKHQLLINTLMS